MKKIIIILTFFIFPFFANAEEITKFSLSEVTASPDNTVTINLNMDNKQEFSVLTAKIYYDNTKLTYVSSKLNGLKNSFLNGAEENQEKGLIAIYAINLNNSKLMKDTGNILTIAFQIAKDVTEDIPLTLEIKDFGLVDSTSLDYTVENGIIHIKNGIKTVSKDDKTSVINDIKEELKEQGIEEKDITITSTNEDIAIVDEEGNVEFKNDGNVDIVAKDNEGNIVYSKGYFVKTNIKKPNRIILPIIITIMIIFIIIVIRSKNVKNKFKNH